MEHYFYMIQGTFNKRLDRGIYTVVYYISMEREALVRIELCIELKLGLKETMGKVLTRFF